MTRHDSPSYPLFDWLRILLATLVFIDHADVTTLISPGNFAVQVFFAMSGWLIGGILLDTRAEQLPRFFYNRVTRIWMPYLFAVILLYSVAALKEGFAPYYFQTLAFDLTLTHNWFIEKVPSVISAMPMQGTGTHFWSIAVEEQFYLFAPLLLVVLPVGRSPVLWAAIVACALIWFGFYSAIAGGVLAIVLRRRAGDWHLTTPGQVGLWVALIAVTAIFVSGRIEYALAAPVVAVVIVLLAARPGQRTPASEFFGGISYPMYLNHWTGLFFGNAVLSVLPQMGRLAAQSLGLVFALAAAAAAYWVVDRNVMAWRGAFYQPRFGRYAMIAAYSLMLIGVVLGRLVIGPLTGAP